MKIIVGLGNPGRKYAPTRHNAGFEVIDKLAYDYNIKTERLRFKAFCGEGLIRGERVLLLKPQTFMNLSGESVREAMAFYKLEPKDLIVVCDDISLPVGMARIRPKGSDAGQKGLRNIIDRIKTDAFVRVKVGIGAPPPGFELVDFVLSKFTADELPGLIRGVTRATEAIEILLTQGIDAAMSKTNERIKKPSAEKPEKNTPEKEEKSKQEPIEQEPAKQESTPSPEITE
ncbi:MAG: aminoacyl-tRNA hydrolase [Firmicutes bacterium]|nr:aminoacyl-tRNA hydrolase [Bacillota bacterium]